MADFGNPVQETTAERFARWQAIERRYAEADARAAELSRDVFQPLLAEFQEVLESDGILIHGFTTERYVREVTLPAVERGLAKAGRSRALSAGVPRRLSLTVSEPIRRSRSNICTSRKTTFPITASRSCSISRRRSPKTNITACRRTIASKPMSRS